jgi:hypothetical protein
MILHAIKYIYLVVGKAVAQEISHWLPTAVIPVQAQDKSRRICGGQSGTGADFPKELWFHSIPRKK